MKQLLKENFTREFFKNYGEKDEKKHFLQIFIFVCLFIFYFL